MGRKEGIAVAKWTEEQRVAMKALFPGLSEAQIAFVERADEFSDTRPPYLNDRQWGWQVEVFLKEENLSAWEALGEALTEAPRLPRAVWREKHPFGACLAAALQCLEVSDE